jgi:hypothetical protein
MIFQTKSFLRRSLPLCVALFFCGTGMLHSGESRAQVTSASTREAEPSPQEKMLRRFPQPVKVADLIGLPVLDYDDSTIGRVERVVRTATGNILLIVPYGGWFGWGDRPVAVPIETVVILGRQLDALEMTREDFDKAPAWPASEGKTIDGQETIRIAISRR